MPATPPSEPKAPRRLRGCLLPFLLLVLSFSLLLNFAGGLIYTGAIENPIEPGDGALSERIFLGDPEARDKIAVVRVLGTISDSGIQFPLRQLEAAAKDKHVKAIVLRIDSPGGTVSASEELYQNILNARENNGRRFKGSGPKPVSVSMGGVAASGGYYIAVAGQPISAEVTTITGSIGVFAALPNVAEWGQQHGVKVELVKAGGMKASGSFFHSVSPEERQTWQDTVDNAYDQFLKVINSNRPQLAVADLRDQIIIERIVAKRDEKGNPVLENGKEVLVKYTRKRADGGTFTTAQALDAKLIDKIQDLPTAIRDAANLSGLSSFKAVTYDRTPGLLERFTGLQIKQPQPFPDLSSLAETLSPRLWYLVPAAEGGILTHVP